MTMKADRLRHARTLAGYETASDAARAIGVAPPTYAGHENGSRGFSAETARRYARAFRVAPEWLVYGTGQGPDGRAAPPPEPAELCDDAVPFTPRAIQHGESLDAYLAPKARHRLTYTAPIGALYLGILAGDLLVIDMNSAPQPGQTVLASVLDVDTTQTRILRYLPPFLVSGDPNEPPIPESEARVQGPIVALARGPGL